MDLLVRNHQIQASAHQFARLLDKLAVPDTAVVAALLPNCAEFLTVLRGVTWSARHFTPVNWHLTDDDIAYVLSNANTAVLVVHIDFIDRISRIGRVSGAPQIQTQRIIVVGGAAPAGYTAFADIENFSDAALASSRAGSIMMYTSGTTGRPKGVVLGDLPDTPPPCYASRMGSLMLQTYLDAAADGKHLVAAPLYHAAPSTYAEGAALLGADVVIMPRWDPEEFLRIVDAEKIVSTFLVPTQIVRLLQLPESVRDNYSTHSLRLLCHGAAPISQAIKQQAMDWLGPVLFEFYGATEGGGTSIGPQEWLQYPGSVGKPRPGLHIHILDDKGNTCAVGDIGDVYFSSSGVRFEYKDAPEKTADAWRGDKYTLGDIGYVDTDGYLYLCDRRADTIICGGVNIYPAQIEAVLLQHDAVHDCCVVGLLDEEWGETVMAVVQGRLDTTIDDILRNDLLAFCAVELASYQLPRRLEFVDSLPRTEAGKLLRRNVRDAARSDSLAVIEC